MHVFSVVDQAEFDPKKHVEKILGTIEAGDVTVACWEPDQVSPYHCHPHATEIYFCFEGGGTMRTPAQNVAVVPGAFVHPPARCTNMPMGRSARCYFAFVTAATWRRGTWIARPARLDPERGGRRLLSPASGDVSFAQRPARRALR